MRLLDYLAAAGGNPEWSLSFLKWQQEKKKAEKEKAMRLIDADKLVKDIWKLHKKTEEQYDLCADELKDLYCGIVSTIDSQPTSYDVDKVVEQLENEMERAKKEVERGRGLLIKEPFTPYIKAIEIVKRASCIIQI